MATKDNCVLPEEQTTGSRIKKYRKRLKITQKQLADMVGISVNYLAMLEKDRRNASAIVLRKLARELGVEIEELKMGDEYAKGRNLAQYQVLCKTYNSDEISEALQIAAIYLKAKRKK